MRRVNCATHAARLVPYKSFAAFGTVGKVSPRRGEGPPPYSLFYCSLLIIKYSVGNGLDRSETVGQFLPHKRKKN